MTSCTIIISHYESPQFLKTCIRQIRKYVHPEIRQHIIVADQSSDVTLFFLLKEYEGADDVEILTMKPLWSGYGIDYTLRYGYVKTEYVCQIHVDAFPIHKNWLHLPIKLIEEYDFSFVGQLQFISKPTDEIYPPSPFFAMAQCFNVAKTETYLEMAQEAGFTRWHDRPQADPKMEYNNRDWEEWAKIAPNQGGSDDDVPAFHWEDKYRTHDKLGLAITGYIEPSYGRIIEGLVFHFGSCREAIGVMGRMPARYQMYTEEIKANYSDELIEEMVELARMATPPELEILTRNFWDGHAKTSSPTSELLNQRIEWLKQ